MAKHDELSPNAEAMISTVRQLAAHMRDNQGVFVYGHDDLCPVTDEGVALKNVQYDMRDLAVTFTMLLGHLLELRELDRRIRSVTGTMQGNINDVATVEALNRQRVLDLEAEVLLKAVYNGMYGVAEMLEAPSLRGVVRKDVSRRLGEVLQVRHGLVTHKRLHKVHLRGTRLHHRDDLVARFGVPMPVGDMPDREHRAAELWKQAKVVKPALVPSEGNTYEQIQWLYENQSHFEGSLRAAIKRCVETFGVQSHTPLVLARLVLDLAVDLIPGPKRQVVLAAKVDTSLATCE